MLLMLVRRGNHNEKLYIKESNFGNCGCCYARSPVSFGIFVSHMVKEAEETDESP